MRSIPLLLALVLLVGCADAIGLGASCAGEMRDVRRAEGSPDQTARTSGAGNFEEQWLYLAASASPGRVYTFRWGLSYQSCEVSGPQPLIQGRRSGPEPGLMLLSRDPGPLSPNRR